MRGFFIVLHVHVAILNSLLITVDSYSDFSSFKFLLPNKISFDRFSNPASLAIVALANLVLANMC